MYHPAGAARLIVRLILPKFGYHRELLKEN